MAKKKEAEHHCCEKMCAMTCCPCHLDIKKLKPLVRNAEVHLQGMRPGGGQQDVSLRTSISWLMRLRIAASGPI